MADTTLTGTLSTTFVDKPDDVLSAKTYADAAANAANAASTSENNAATSEANSKKSETAAKISETNAASSATAAATSETNAASSKTAAALSETNAKSSATAAAQSESNASTYEQQAKSQADAAITTVATLTYATDAEATAGTATDRMISPATLKAVIDADKATNDEAKAGTSDKVITASALKAVIDSTVLAAVLLAAHPVGSYYWSNDSTDPGTLFGGTWEALPPGYTLIAQGAGSDSFGSFTYTAGQKYGERKHQLTTDELPHLEGRFPASVTSGYQSDTTGIVSGVDGFTKSTWASDSNTWGFNIAFGGNQPHENIPPTIASYGWKRTA